MTLPLLLAPFLAFAQAAPAQEEAEVKTQAHEGFLLEKEAARDWKALLQRLQQADAALYQQFHTDLAGALLRFHAPGGLRYDARKQRWEWDLPPSVVRFVEPELGGDWAWKAFVRQALLQREQVLKLAGGEQTAELLARASARLADPKVVLEVGQTLYDRRGDWKIGVPPRRKSGKPADRELDPALGVPLLDPPWVLVGAPPDWQLLHQVLAPLRADEEARPWMDSVDILYVQPGKLTSATWYFEDKEVGVALGISGDARSAAAVVQAGLVDKVRGAAVAVAGQEDLDRLFLSANALGMAVWWHDISQVRNPPTPKETTARMQQESDAFLLRNGGRPRPAPPER